MSAVEVHRVVDGSADAPVLVLSNSLGSVLTMWDPQIPALSERFRVVRYDLRGHGASPVPPGPYDIADLGADLLGVLDGLGVEQADLAGLSIGGLVSMWVSANTPARVRRLILCCTSPWFGSPESWLERAAMVRREGMTSVADTVVGRWFTPRFAASHADEVANMRAMIAATPAGGYASCCEVVAKTDLRPSLSAIRAPTLVIAGAQDPAVSVEQATQLAAAIPDARLAVVQDASHLANVEQPDEVTGLMLDALPA